MTSYVVVTDMPDYCERDAALELAAQMQANVKIVRANEADFVAALPRTTHAVEEPMFNLHPVAKLLLAEAMAADGVEVAITGDGADWCCAAISRPTICRYAMRCSMRRRSTCIRRSSTPPSSRI